MCIIVNVVYSTESVKFRFVRNRWKEANINC